MNIVGTPYLQQGIANSTGGFNPLCMFATEAQTPCFSPFYGTPSAGRVTTLGALAELLPHLQRSAGLLLDSAQRCLGREGAGGVDHCAAMSDCRRVADDHSKTVEEWYGDADPAGAGGGRGVLWKEALGDNTAMPCWRAARGPTCLLSCCVHLPPTTDTHHLSASVYLQVSPIKKPAWALQHAT